ncbi:MAG: 50S ribosomal protein L15 [Treponema sp.]|nr:50S ribosomal protein L15 [Treponema sp.]
MSDFTLKAPVGANKKPKRVGRGSSSGLGTTAGRGNKGQQSRSGKRVPYVGFEGGQMPLYRRIARRGFSNAPFKKEYAILNVADLEKKFADGETVNRESLKARRLVGKVKDGIKILGNGDISKKLVIEVEKISAAAKEKVEKAGGSVQLIPEKSVKSK